MKGLLIISLMISFNVYSETKKNKTSAAPVVTAENSKAVTKEAPCADPKEDILKKLEEKKKSQAMLGKGLSLQGSTDTGCSLK